MSANPGGIRQPAGLWRCGGHALAVDRPLVMGIVNVTPDSFSDGGRYADTAAAVAHARRLIADGADLLDIGGESTRPGAAPVDEAEELRRVLPLLRSLAGCGVALSVDTSKPAVMRAALAEGASIVNDVRALQAPGALAAVAATDCGVVLMHMRGEPSTMQDVPQYRDVVGEVVGFLGERLAACVTAGISAERIVLDPGIGFGKTAEHNVELLHGLPRLAELGRPLLIGLSRKKFIGTITGRVEPAARDGGSVGAALWAVGRGARIVRVHDVAATRDALKVWFALETAR